MVSSSMGGNSMSFMLPDGVSPSEVMELAELALGWCQSQVNPDAPDLALRPISQLRVNFSGGFENL